MASSSSTATTGSSYNRMFDVQAFEDSKLGVKGLLDSGITELPKMFIHDPSKVFALPVSDNGHLIPVIDMSLNHAEVVQKILQASATTGFFQIVNHGVPVDLCDRVLTALKAFHEKLPPHEKMVWYGRDPNQEKELIFFSNHDLFKSSAASWRDTLQIRPRPQSTTIPNICRSEVLDWDREMKTLGFKLLGMFSEGLGLPENKLRELTSLERVCVFANYYPFCPEPQKTMGITSHTNPGVMTVLLQDMTGGLQVLHDGKWVNLKPVRGALVVNIGDLLQIVSNDTYTSGLHRVVANASRHARLSVAVTFSKGIMNRRYGPLPELVTEDTPSRYDELTFGEFLLAFMSKGLDGKLMVQHYRRPG